MGRVSLTGVRLAGLVAALPSRREFNMDNPHISERELQFICKNTGINERRILSKDQTAADICFFAASQLLSGLGWRKEDIKILVFISQTPDYLTPATAVLLQDRLGLNNDCLAFDINLGCSAYPYGLASVGSLLQTMGEDAKALLLVGDKSSQLVSERDKSTALLFSDAGSATALECSPVSEPGYFDLFSDGRGWKSLYVKGGGGRFPAEECSIVPEEREPGIHRSDLQLSLSGIDIFNFSIHKVVPTISETLDSLGLSGDDLDYFVFHQANQLLNQTMIRKLGIDPAKFPNSLSKFGNTSSASIPVTLVSELADSLSSRKLLLFLSGFGVGLSWGNAVITCDQIYCPPVLEFD